MLFNSYEFLFYFLPIVFIVYFLFLKLKFILLSRLWLIGSSLFFYSWWNVSYLPLILGSLFFNYFIGTYINKVRTQNSKKTFLIVGIVGNISLLGYFKYYDFFISNINSVFNTNITLLHLALPLAISFFTFQQIAYLVDSYRGETKGYKFSTYALFVTFFPQLIAGPIVHHKEMMPQFDEKKNHFISTKNITLGFYIFFIGLFKKLIIADTFAIWATKGFDKSTSLTFFDGWLASLSYTFQLYFDFSGYCDMAIGAALLFNIRLPINFNSPYKSLNISDFWRRWHMTLNRFLTHYLYIPLGGSKKGEFRTYTNILIVFLISGLWHGAGWTFIFWGFLHGLASMIYRFWKKLNKPLHSFIAWFITFNFVNIAWVFFRAQTWTDATKVLSAMFALNGFALPSGMVSLFEKFANFSSLLGTNFLFTTFTTSVIFVSIVLCMWIVVFMKNSIEMIDNFKPTASRAIFLAFITVVSILSLNRVSEFLYFNF